MEKCEEFNEKCKIYDEKKKAVMQAYAAINGLDDTYLAYSHENVIPHWPPALIIGK